MTLAVFIRKHIRFQHITVLPFYKVIAWQISSNSTSAWVWRHREVNACRKRSRTVFGRRETSTLYSYKLWNIFCIDSQAINILLVTRESYIFEDILRFASVSHWLLNVLAVFDQKGQVLFSSFNGLGLYGSLKDTQRPRARSGPQKTQRLSMRRFWMGVRSENAGEGPWLQAKTWAQWRI